MKIVLPSYIQATDTRRHVIGGALWDVRETYGTANVAEVGDWIEAYLGEWDRVRREAESSRRQSDL